MKEAEKNVETLHKGMKKSKRMPIFFEFYKYFKAHSELKSTAFANFPSQLTSAWQSG